MKIRRMLLNYLWLLLALPLAAATSRIYVANAGGNEIDVIDPVTNTVVDVIPNVEAPMVARFSPDGSRVYITAFSENALLVLDRETGKQIKKVPLTGKPDDVAVTKDGKLIAICIYQEPGGLDIVDATSLEKIKTIQIKGGLHDIVATDDSKYAIATSSAGHTLEIFDLQKKEIVWELPLTGAGGPLTIESGPDGSARRVFISFEGFHGFVAMDFATRKLEKISLPDQLGPFTFNGKSCHGIGVAPDGQSLWVNSAPNDAVFAYSLPDLKLLGYVALPKMGLPGKSTPLTAGPDWLTFSGDSKTVYITNRHLKSVTAIDVKSIKEVAVVSVGDSPARDSTLVIPDAAVAPVASASPPTLDYEFFKTRVQPIFLKKRSAEQARCYTCHEERGFGHHPTYLVPLSPGSTFWNEEQSRRNFENVSRLVVPGNPKSRLLIHPLAPEAGGDALHVHMGGRKFASQNDPDWQTILDWVLGKKVTDSSGQ